MTPPPRDRAQSCPLRRLAFSLLAAAASTLAVAAGCGGTTNGTRLIGGESHFLHWCSDSCEGDGLECISGLCTHPCVVADQSGCSAFGNSSCTSQSIEPGAVAVCDVSCAGDADCATLGGDYRCDRSFCRAPLIASVSSTSTTDTVPSTDAAPMPDAGATGCHSSADCSPLGDGVWDCHLPGPRRCGPVQPEKVGVPCTSDGECGAGSICRKTSASSGELACVRAAGCTDDSQCVAGLVCRDDPTVPSGWLDPSGLVCSAPCATDLDCAATRTCESGGHCRERTCAECPSYFSCTSGTCVIPNCSTDEDCPGGYCVNTTCARSLGECQMLCL